MFGAKGGAAILAAVGLCGMALVVLPFVAHGEMPGDLGDARFNLYVLEHFYRWAIGADPSFWSADFFYPSPLTITYSDNHIGTGPVYALFRLLGFDKYDSFRIWFVLGFAADYAAAAYAIRRLGYGALAAGLGAFLFAFALPMTAQAVHAQLICRVGVPLAILGLVQFSRECRPRPLVLAVAWTVWQFYCSIYIGYFLVIVLVALVLAGIGEWPRIFRRLRDEWRPRDYAGAALPSVALGALLVPLFQPYIHASHMYGFHRDWPLIESMVPRLQSYLYAPTSPIWRGDNFVFQHLPMAHEHGLFIGLAPFLAIGAALILRRYNKVGPDPIFRVMAVATLLVMLLTLWVHGHSLYRFLALLPGANSIRAVARVGTVLLFPVGVLFAASVDAVLRARTLAPGWRFGIVGAIAALLVVECSDINRSISPVSEWRGRMDALAARLPADLPAAPIIDLAGHFDVYVHLNQLDGMLFAQERGWRTVNGYSGNMPPGYSYEPVCSDAVNNLRIGLAFRGVTDPAALKALERDLVLIGYPPC